HDLLRRQRTSDRRVERLENALARLRERAVMDRRSSLLMTAAAEHARQGRSIELPHAGSGDAEDSPFHLHQANERPTVGEVDDLVSEIRDPVHVLWPRDGRDEDLEPAG